MVLRLNMSSKFEVRRACHEDSTQLLALMAGTSQEGSIELNFERSPNYFYATEISTSDPDVWVMEDSASNELAAVFSIGKRWVYVNGVKELVRYGSDLRIHQDYQGGRTLYQLFKHYKDLMQSDWMQTVILEENDASINTVSSGRLNLPTYYPFGRIVTHSIDSSRSIFSDLANQVRPATQSDVGIMQDFFNANAPLKQFYPHYDFSLIGSDHAYYRDIKFEDIFLLFKENRLAGMCGAWDQKKFKQTRFVSYKGVMKFLRVMNNIKTYFSGGILLPKPGQCGDYITLHSILLEDNDSRLFLGLLSAIQQAYENRKYDAITFGLDEKDPLNASCKHLKGIRLYSQHFLASYGSNPVVDVINQPIFYPEVGRL